MFTIPTNNRWSCLPASFSMACNCPFTDFINFLGHDGDTRPYKDKSKRRGFHPQECIDVAWKLGFTCTPIERYPALVYSYNDTEILPIYFRGSDDGNMARFMLYLQSTQRGVIEGIRKRADGLNVGHAVAWDGSFIYDPSHRIYTLEDGMQNNFVANKLWILTEVGYDKTNFLDI